MLTLSRLPTLFFIFEIINTSWVASIKIDLPSHDIDIIRRKIASIQGRDPYNLTDAFREEQAKKESRGWRRTI